MLGNPTADPEAETSVVYELTGRDGPLTRSALYAACRKFSVGRIVAALDSLEAVGVLCMTEDTVEASEALKRLDALGVIPV
jgi:hypothetical protein